MRSDDRRVGLQLVAHERDQHQPAGDAQRAWPGSPPPLRRLRDAEQREGQAAGPEHETRDVEGRSSRWPKSRRRRRPSTSAERADGHVDEEQPVPADVGDEPTAQRRADRRAAIAATPQMPMAWPRRSGGKTSNTMAMPTGIIAPPPTPWITRKRDEHAHVGRQAAAQRGDRERHEGAEEDLLAAEAVGHPRGGGLRRRDGQQVRRDDPLDAVARVEVVADRGQRDVHDRGVEHDHERPDEDEAEQRPGVAPRPPRPRGGRGGAPVGRRGLPEPSARELSTLSARIGEPLEQRANSATRVGRRRVGDQRRRATRSTARVHAADRGGQGSSAASPSRRRRGRRSSAPTRPGSAGCGRQVRGPRTAEPAPVAAGSPRSASTTSCTAAPQPSRAAAPSAGRSASAAQAADAAASANSTSSLRGKWRWNVRGDTSTARRSRRWSSRRSRARRTGRARHGTRARLVASFLRSRRPRSDSLLLQDSHIHHKQPSRTCQGSAIMSEYDIGHGESAGRRCPTASVASDGSAISIRPVEATHSKRAGRDPSPARRRAPDACVARPTRGGGAEFEKGASVRRPKLDAADGDVDESKPPQQRHARRLIGHKDAARAKIEPETRQRKKTGARVRRSCRARGGKLESFPRLFPVPPSLWHVSNQLCAGASTVDDDQVTSEPAWAGDESSSAPRHRGAARPRPRRFRRVVGRFVGWRVYLLAVMSV